MIAATSNHKALLATRTFWACDLFVITMVDGTVLRYVMSGISVSWNGYTYQAGPKFRRGDTRIVRGLEADTLNVTIDPKLTDLLLGLPFIAAVRNGAFDGARLELWRGHAATPGAPLVGAIQRFGGDIEDIETEDVIQLTVKSDLAKFDAPIPRAVYQPGCDRTLYGPGCDVSRAAFQLNASAVSGSTVNIVKVAAGVLGGTPKYYAGGELRFVSGANAGARRSVKAQPDSVSLQLAYPLSNPVTNGDAFTLWPGCAHDTVDCDGKFGNLPRFRGEPFIPVPETAF